ISGTAHAGRMRRMASATKGATSSPPGTRSLRTASGGRTGSRITGPGAKSIARRPAVLIVDEPTRGIDVGTKAEVHHLLTELARGGVGVLMISSELPEVLGVSDRILVMREGALGAEFSHADASEEAVMSAAMGQHDVTNHGATNHGTTRHGANNNGDASDGAAR